MKAPKKLGDSIHDELRSLLRHFYLRLQVHERLPAPDLRVTKEFINWVEATPKARKVFRQLGVIWRRKRP